LGLVQTTAPTTEPVTTAEAKAHLRVTFTDDDTYIDGLVASARAWCETYTGRQFVTATWTWKLDEFPSVFSVPRPSLVSVTSIVYIDENGASQTLATSVYDVDTTSKPGRVALAYNQTWPDIRGDIDSVSVVFVAGYGAESSVPDAIKSAILLLVGHWYANREDVVIGTIAGQLPNGAKALLSPYKLVRVS